MEVLTPAEPSSFGGPPLELVVSPSAEDERDGSDESDTVNDEIDVESRNRALQTLFEENMDNVGNKRSHSKVAVLLISWVPEGEDYIDAGIEVDRLEDVFQQMYNFKVYKKRLHTKQGKPASHQMNLHLAQFIHDEDGHDTLLVIYYAGHGIRNIKPGDLILVGGNPKNGNKGLNQIVWNEAEKQLERASADLFVIFDCCYAGQLAISTRSVFSSKIFEFLGATQANNLALSPGPESFSTALAWALEKLANHEDGFTTLQLEQKIKLAPRFPSKTQVPCLTARGEPSLRRLKIAPLPREPTETVQKPLESQKQDAEMINYYLQLHLLFSSCPDETHVNYLTNHLMDLVRSQSLPLRQVLWRGLFSKDTARVPKLDLATLAVRKWHYHTRNSKSFSESPKKNSGTTIVLQQTPPPRTTQPPALQEMIPRERPSSRQETVEPSQDLATTEKISAGLEVMRSKTSVSGYVLIDRGKWVWVLPLFSVCFAFVLGRILSEFSVALALNVFN